MTTPRDVRPGSPTELIPESSDDEDLISAKEDDNEKPGDVGGCSKRRDAGAMAVDATGGSPGRGKRSREPPGPSAARPRRHGGDRPEGREVEQTEDNDGAPVTSGELRRLLEVHLGPIAASWTEMTGKVKSLEEERDRDRQEREVVLGRVVHIENERVDEKKDREVMHGRIARMEQKGAGVDAQISQLTKDVEDLKQRTMAKPAPSGGNAGDGRSDPWAEYRVKHGPAPGMPGSGAAGPGHRDAPSGGSVAGEELSEEDKRTLIVGGWAQDSKKQVILDESEGFLGRSAVKELIDQTALTVWGPRRSFGVLKFVLSGMVRHRRKCETGCGASFSQPAVSRTSSTRLAALAALRNCGAALPRRGRRDAGAPMGPCSAASVLGWSRTLPRIMKHTTPLP